jgi:hypothetical protein
VGWAFFFTYLGLRSARATLHPRLYSAAGFAGSDNATMCRTFNHTPPEGYGHWTLQLLADELVALEIVDAISHETVRKALKKTV